MTQILQKSRRKRAVAGVQGVECLIVGGENIICLEKVQ